MKPRVPQVLYDVAAVFCEAGHECFVVGGALRNIALNKTPQDYDLATDASPAEVQGLFRRTIPTGIKHGTVIVRFRGHSFEVTTFRTESEYSDGRRPDRVRYGGSIEEDLSRRDFTINGILFRCSG